MHKLSDHPLPVSAVMEEAAKTFKLRQSVYGDNYRLAAKALESLFPNGVPLKTAEDHERFHIFMLIIVKLSRYANGWDKPHQDSIHDAGIYSFMLEAIDKNQQLKKENNYEKHSSRNKISKATFSKSQGIILSKTREVAKCDDEISRNKSRRNRYRRNGF